MNSCPRNQGYVVPDNFNEEKFQAIIDSEMQQISHQPHARDKSDPKAMKHIQEMYEEVLIPTGLDCTKFLKYKDNFLVEIKWLMAENISVKQQIIKKVSAIADKIKDLDDTAANNDFYTEKHQLKKLLERHFAQCCTCEKSEKSALNRRMESVTTVRELLETTRVGIRQLSQASGILSYDLWLTREGMASLSSEDFHALRKIAYTLEPLALSSADEYDGRKIYEVAALDTPGRMYNPDGKKLPPEEIIATDPFKALLSKAMQNGLIESVPPVSEDTEIYDTAWISGMLSEARLTLEDIFPQCTTDPQNEEVMKLREIVAGTRTCKTVRLKKLRVSVASKCQTALMEKHANVEIYDDGGLQKILRNYHLTFEDILHHVRPDCFPEERKDAMWLASIVEGESTIRVEDLLQLHIGIRQACLAYLQRSQDFAERGARSETNNEEMVRDIDRNIYSIIGGEESVTLLWAKVQIQKKALTQEKHHSLHNEFVALTQENFLEILDGRASCARGTLHEIANIARSMSTRS